MPKMTPKRGIVGVPLSKLNVPDALRPQATRSSEWN